MYAHGPQMRFPNDLEFVEFDSRRVILHEPPFYVGAVLFFVFAAIPFLARTGPRTEALIVGIVTSGGLSILALFCCVDSTYTVTHGDPALRVRRELWVFKWVRTYAFSEIKAVTVRKTWGHGDGLVLKLASGRSKSLTRSLHFQVLDREAAALDHAIHVGRERAV